MRGRFPVLPLLELTADAGHFPVLPLLELTADAGNGLPTVSKHKLKNKTLKKDRENKTEENQENIFSVCELPVHACAHGESYQQSTSKQNLKNETNHSLSYNWQTLSSTLTGSLIGQSGNRTVSHRCLR